MIISTAYVPATQDVAIQDQTTPIVILPMAQELVATTLAATAVIDVAAIEVTDNTDFVVGLHLRIINAGADRFFAGTILAINGNIISLDNLIDFAYEATSEVTVSNVNLAVDGSTTPVFFTMRTGAPSVPTAIDITRIIFTCTTSTAIDLSGFGDLPALVKGLMFRFVNGVTQNIFNLKTNTNLANLCYDFVVHEATNPAQGVDGFLARLTFAGPAKMGVAIRVGQDDNLQAIVQDDLSDLLSFIIVVQGHTVEERAIK